MCRGCIFSPPIFWPIFIAPHHWCCCLSLSRLPPISSSSLPTCSLLTRLPLYLLFFLPCHLHPPARSAAVLSIFLGCGCHVSAVTLISSGNVSILSILLRPRQLTSYLVCLYPTHPTNSAPFYSHLFLLAVFYLHSCSHLFFPLQFPFGERECVCVCVSVWEGGVCVSLLWP